MEQKVRLEYICNKCNEVFATEIRPIKKFDIEDTKQVVISFDNKSCPFCNEMGEVMLRIDGERTMDVINLADSIADSADSEEEKLKKKWLEDQLKDKDKYNVPLYPYQPTYPPYYGPNDFDPLNPAKVWCRTNKNTR